VLNYDIGYREPNGFFHPVPVRKRRAAGKLIRIVLAVCHVNHVCGDDREENLLALCQRCHLKLDEQPHVQGARQTRITKKDSHRPLFCMAS
jgi:hypothetical protein